jgi:cell division protein FtsL
VNQIGVRQLRGGLHLPGAGRLALAAAAILVGGMTLVLVGASLAAVVGYNVDHLDRQKTLRQRQIAQLQAEVGTLKSLDRIERRARDELKMAPPTSYLYVTVDRLPDAPTPLLKKALQPETAQQPDPARSWWDTLRTALLGR